MIKPHIFHSHQLLLAQTHTITRPGPSAVGWTSKTAQASAPETGRLQHLEQPAVPQHIGFTLLLA